LDSHVRTSEPVCCSGHNLPPEDRKVLEDSSRFHELYVATKLPPAIVALCADESGRFAEPGQNWQATDTVNNPSLPRKRLIWAAVGGEYYAVHYERGGRGHSFHVRIATFSNGDHKPRVVWRGVGERLKNYSAFSARCEAGSWMTGWIMRIDAFPSSPPQAFPRRVRRDRRGYIFGPDESHRVITAERSG